MNQIYFEWYEFDVNVVRILIAIVGLINQCCNEYEWITSIVDSLILKISWVLMSYSSLLHSFENSQKTQDFQYYGWSHRILRGIGSNP